jgi:Domain of unknown function (DU1801)
MQSTLKNVMDYVKSVPKERAEAFRQFRKVILSHLPNGYEECMSYGMIGYVVPQSLYPKCYHCDSKLPLPFVSLASQKNFIALYHMGMYADKKILEWFVAEYPKHCKKKLDMGKSCVRFKYIDDIPFELIGELMKKMSVKEWITLYEKHFK